MGRLSGKNNQTKSFMENFVEIRIYVPDEVTRYLVTQNLMAVDYEGVEEDGNFLIAYCEEEMYDEDLLKIMLDYPDITFNKQIIPAQNWNALWESSFERVIVDDFVAVRASFHASVLDAEHEIIITPKMSFGTGHHATTFMMMQQMRELDFTNKLVADFGTGTGVLAILAEKMGAKKVVAIDNDEWSIANAKENIEANNCRNIFLIKDDSLHNDSLYDIVLANINKNIILENLQAFAACLNENGLLLISGLLKEDEEEIMNEMKKFSLEHIFTLHRGAWISLRFAR